MKENRFAKLIWEAKLIEKRDRKRRSNTWNMGNTKILSERKLSSLVASTTANILHLGNNVLILI